MFYAWKSPSIAKSPQKRLLSILFVIILIAAMFCVAWFDDHGLSRNTEYDTKLLATTNDAILNNYIADEFLDFDQSTTKAVIVRGKWNEQIENIDSWSKTTTQLEEDLWLFTFDTPNDAYLVTSRMTEDDNQYCFEAIFDVATEFEELSIEDTETLEAMTESINDANMKPVTIAVLDTGYSGTSDKVLKGFSVIDEGNSIKDENGHGTRMIDIIDSMTYDNVSILPIKVANKDGFATILSVSSGIRIAMEQNVDIINISMNAYTSDSAFLLEEAIKEANAAGIKVVVSAGNKGVDTKNIIPANIDEAIVISATALSEAFEDYSNYGETIDYATFGNYYGVGGTSISAARFSAMLGYKLGVGEGEESLKEVAYYPEIVDTSVDYLDRAEYEEIDPKLQYGSGLVNPFLVYEDGNFSTSIMDTVKNRTETTWVGRSDYDIGPNIVNLDWKSLDTEELDKYLIETHYAFVGELFANLSESELKELVSKSDIAKTDVEEVVFTFDADKMNGNEILGETESSKNLNFVEYCLSEYELHKEDLTISSDYWWYDNTGAIYLKDNHGSTKFTLYAPREQYQQTVNWNQAHSIDNNLISVSGIRSTDSYMKISKTSGAANGPQIDTVGIVMTGFSSYISIYEAGGESAVRKFPNVSYMKQDTGSIGGIWQFTFKGYDVGEAGVGKHFYYFGEDDGSDSANGYDINVRPYGYWDTASWQNGKPSGKLHTNATCATANTNYGREDYQAYMGETIELWDAGRCQGYVYLSLDTWDYTSNIQSVRKQGYTTTALERADVVQYLYFNGLSNLSQTNIVDLNYMGETADTVDDFLDINPGAKFIEIKALKEYSKLFPAAVTEDRYIPLFSSSDYPLASIQTLDLYRVSSVWYYGKATAANATNSGSTNTNLDNTTNLANDIMIAGKTSSYNPVDKKVTITGGSQAWGFSQLDYGDNKQRATQTDTPEVYIQTVANKIDIVYGATLADNFKANTAVYEDWIAKTKSENGLCDTFYYGQTITTRESSYSPSISGFSASNTFRLEYIGPNGESRSYAYTNSNSIKDTANGILAETSGGTLHVDRIYTANLSALVINPGNGTFLYGGKPYTENNPLIVYQTPGTTFVLGEPNASAMNFTATFLAANGTSTYTTMRSNLTWNVSSPWTVKAGTIDGVQSSAAANGKLLSANAGVGTNLYAYAPIGSKAKYYTSAGNGATAGNEGWSIQGNWVKADPGYYYIDLPTGGSPRGYMNTAGNFNSGCMTLTSLGYRTLTATTYFRTSILDYCYSGISALDANGYTGAGNAYGPTYYKLQPASKDWKYQFGSVANKVDVVKPNITGSTTITLPAGPAKSGYTFVGWLPTIHENTGYTSGVLAAGTVINLTDWGNVTFKPYYTSNSQADVTITLVPETSKLSNSGTTVIYQKYGSGFYSDLACTKKITSITIPTYTNGVSFAGYYDNMSNLRIKEDGTIDMSPNFTANTTLYGKTKLTSYKITLNKNGVTPINTCDSIIYSYYDRYFTNANHSITQTVTTPVAYGYQFLGYYEVAMPLNAGLTTTMMPIIDSSGNIVVSSTYFNANTTIYAAWANVGYDVYLDFNDGTLPEQMIGHKVKYGETSETMNTFNYVPIRPGYTFNGWYDSATNGNLVYRVGSGERMSTSKYFDSAGRYIHYDDMILYARWTSNNYTVTYDGSFNGIEPTGGATPDSNHIYDTPSALTLNGYELILSVLYNGNDGTSSTASSIPQSVDQTIGQFMGWIADIYYANVLTLDSHSGMFVTNSESSKTKEITIVENLAGSALTVTSSNNNVATAVISGNKLVVTATTPGNCVITITSAATNRYIETSTTYYVTAKEATPYTLTFNPNGGSCDVVNKTLVTDDVYGTLPIATKTGYTFTGWYTQPAGGTRVSEATVMEDSNVIVYAQYVPITYTIEYYGNGADGGTTASSTHTYGSSSTVTTNGFQKTGYTFKGWATSANDNVAYINNATVFNLTTTHNDVIKLYAVWEANEYEIKYDGNNAVSGVVPNSYHTYDVATTLNANMFLNPGYTFAGWSTSETGSVEYTDEESVINLTGIQGELVTLYAVWDPHQYTITYNGNGEDSGTTPDSTHVYGIPSSFSSNGFVKDGYVLDGWLCDGVLYAPDASILNLTETDGAVLTAYAIWKEKEYTVSYNGNGSTGGSVANSTHTYNVESTLNANKYTRTGWKFIGWSTTPNGDVEYTDGQLVINLTTADEIILYAVWQDVTPPTISRGSEWSTTSSSYPKTGRVTNASGGGLVTDDGSGVKSIIVTLYMPNGKPVASRDPYDTTANGRWLVNISWQDAGCVDYVRVHVRAEDNAGNVSEGNFYGGWHE